MPTLQKFKCKECDHIIMASTSPYFVTMAGLYAQCYCKNCNALKNVDAGENYQVDVTKLELHCETCRKQIHVWTPDMGCPICGGDMKRDESIIL